MKMMEVKAGLMIGRKRVVEVYSKGPFAYARTECQCKYKTIREQPIGMLVKGKSVSCSACFRDEINAAIRAVNEQRQVEAAKIRKMFGRK